MMGGPGQRLTTVGPITETLKRPASTLARKILQNPSQARVFWSRFRTAAFGIKALTVAFRRPPPFTVQLRLPQWELHADIMPKTSFDHPRYCAGVGLDCSRLGS